MRILSRLLIVAGLALLGWCGALWIDTTVAQYSARQSLDMMAPALPSPPVVGSAPPGLVTPTPPPAIGAAIAELSIPRVHLSAIILNGSDARTLRRGPGHLPDTAMPGERGNSVIAGHRDTFFRPLRHVVVGDDVFVTGPSGRLRYRIASLTVVRSSDVSVLAATADETLTLITCFPFWVLGDAPDRFIVRAVRADVVNRDLASRAVTTQASDAAVAEPTAMRLESPRDDTALIRDAIDRFRSAYNARLASRSETRDVGPLVFATCEITVDGHRAGVECHTTIAATRRGIARQWRLTLERARGGWAIREIVSN